jgi:2-keto-3-deoxy-L-rhamnonate aldolase RhmA
VVATRVPPLPKNRLRELLKQGKPTIGTHLFSSWPGMTEIVGATGVMDYVEFSSTYAPYDLYDLDNLALAAERHNMGTMIKIDPEPRTFIAQRAIIAGFGSILFADLRTLEQVQDAVRSVRAEPKGTMGCSAGRIGGYQFTLATGADKQFVKYCDDLVVAIMLEKKSLIDKLEDVLNTDGVDMVQFGPCDYAMTVGVHGQFGHKKVLDADRKIIKMALKYDKHPRIEISGDTVEKQMREYQRLGVTDFAIGTDVGIVNDWIRTNGQIARKLLGR